MRDVIDAKSEVLERANVICEENGGSVNVQRGSVSSVTITFGVAGVNQIDDAAVNGVGARGSGRCNVTRSETTKADGGIDTGIIG